MRSPAGGSRLTSCIVLIVCLVVCGWLGVVNGGWLGAVLGLVAGYVVVALLREVVGVILWLTTGKGLPRDELGGSIDLVLDPEVEERRE